MVRLKTGIVLEKNILGDDDILLNFTDVSPVGHPMSCENVTIHPCTVIPAGAERNATEGSARGAGISIFSACPKSRFNRNVDLQVDEWNKLKY